MAKSPGPLSAVFVRHDAPIAFLDYTIDAVQVVLAESHAIISAPGECQSTYHVTGSRRRWRAFVCGAVTGAIKTYTYAR
jgi:hypothetical protein